MRGKNIEDWGKNQNCRCGVHESSQYQQKILISSSTTILLLINPNNAAAMILGIPVKVIT